MDHPESSPSLTVVALVSLALHAVVAVGLSSGAHAARPSHREPIRVTVREVARPVPKPVPIEPALELPAAPAPAAAPEAVAAQAPRVKTKRAESARPAQPAAAPSPPSAAPEALDFTGVTLTNPNGGFAQVAGNGQPMTGPLGAGSGAAGRATGSGTGSGSGKGAAQGAELVALGSLSRPPRAPALDQALAANYPRSAHDVGLAGEAVVRARILASGQVGPTSVIVASAPEFGKACQRTLAGSRWSAPLDATGRPVATELSYKCVFEVTR